MKPLPDFVSNLPHVSSTNPFIKNRSGSIILFFCSFIFLGAIVAPLSAAAPPQFQIEILERPERFSVTSAGAINALGEVLGSGMEHGAWGEVGLLWRDTNVVRRLPPASVMNDVGGFAGSIYTGNHGPDIEIPWYEAFVQLGDSIIPIPSFGGPANGALDINNHGHVVGTGDGPTNRLPFLWKNGVRYNLNDLVRVPDDLTAANAIADDGTIYASTYVYGGGAIFYRLTPMVSGMYMSQRLFQFPAGGHQVINKFGMAVSLRTLWDAHGVHDLGDLGSNRVYAVSVNSHREVVGHAQPHDDESYHGFYWNGTMHDLNKVAPLPGWIIHSAESVNEYGQIAAMAYHPEKRHHAVRLTQSPRIVDSARTAQSIRLSILPGAKKKITVETTTDFVQWHQHSIIEDPSPVFSLELPLANDPLYFRTRRD